MNPKMHPLVAVVRLIETVIPADRGTYCLYVEAHELHLCRAQLVPKDSPKIAIISSLDINTGLPKNLWDRIDARIRIFIKQGILEWNLPKP